MKLSLMMVLQAKQNIPIFDFLADLPAAQKPDTIASIHLADVYGRAGEAPLRGFSEERGFEYVFAEEMPVDTKDVSGVISKLKSTNPDVVIDLCWVPESVLIVRAFRDFDWRPKIYVCQQAYVPDFREALENLVIGVVGRVAFHATELPYDSEPISQQEFVAAFRAKHGEDPGEFPDVSPNFVSSWSISSLAF